VSGVSVADRADRVGRADADDIALPSEEDGIVRGLSEAIGGPVGDHTARPRNRVAAIVMALALLMFSLAWIQKSPCMDGQWGANHPQYTHLCYTDVLALYYAEHLSDGAVPYADWPVEYPVVTGYWMGMLGLPVHALGEDRPAFNQGEAFFNLNALLLSGFGLAAIAVVLALRRKRPWDGALFALAPALAVTATVNWDLLAIGLTSFFMLAWARRRPAIAGAMLGLAGAAKLYPLFLLGALLVLAIRTGRWRATLITAGTTALSWALVNAPVFVFYRHGWNQFWSLSSSRPIDWGTFWYIGVHAPNFSGGTNPPWPFDWLNSNIGALNYLTYVLFGLGCVGVLVVSLLAPRRPRLAQLCFLVIAIFLLTSKVWSQQFVLWLIPLAVMARPRWGGFLIWQSAEVLYFLAFYAQLLTIGGQFVIPEGTFDLAAALRWLTVAMMVGLVVRDILRPELDVVRHTYLDDPDGGDFDEAPDDGLNWIQRQISAWTDAPRHAAA
jgi:uncharacterized membrane protein